MVKRLPKPHFGMSPGFSPDPDFSGNINETELLKLIPARAMGRDKAREFVNRCRELAKSVSAWKTDLSVAVADQKKELELVASRAHALLLALRAMQPGTINTFNGCVAYQDLTTGSPRTTGESREAPHTRAAALLCSVWDSVENLEIGATLTASHCKPRRGRKLTGRRAKDLIVSVAYHVQAITGERPPYSKGTWFPEFMKAYGEMVNIPCGRALLESVLWGVESIDIA
ncbi:MAG: hypothetical protein WCJ69_13215 [Betaproteobacteria bacterium]